MKRNPDTGQSAVLQFMQKHPGIVYTSEFLASEMSLPVRPENTGPLGKSMATLCVKGMIERVGGGKYLYRRMPEPRKPQTTTAVAGSIYEAIGVRKSTGNVIVTDTDNNLYELHEL